MSYCRYLNDFVGMRRGIRYRTRIRIDLLLQFLQRRVEQRIFAIVGLVGQIVDYHVGIEAMTRFT